jgi:hypothetical protein
VWPASLSGEVLVGGEDGETPLRYSALIGKGRAAEWSTALDQRIEQGRTVR